MSNFKKDLNEAMNIFNAFKAEICKEIKGDLVSIELENTKLAKLFDQYSGIDAIQIYQGKLRTVALRMQKSQDKAWNTFTIRYKRKSGTPTEYEKRMDAIFNNRGFLYPYLTIQAYFSKTNDGYDLLSFACVKTEDLYKYIACNMPKIRKRKCKEGNEFLYVDFNTLQQKNIEIIFFDQSRIAA